MYLNRHKSWDESGNQMPMPKYDSRKYYSRIMICRSHVPPNTFMSSAYVNASRTQQSVLLLNIMSLHP